MMGNSAGVRRVVAEVVSMGREEKGGERPQG